MTTYLQTRPGTGDSRTDVQLITALRKTLDESYSRMVTTAAREWERRFGGKDPADACVRVRISSRPAIASR